MTDDPFADIRELVEHYEARGLDNKNVIPVLVVTARALLDAADERDQLRKFASHAGLLRAQEEHNALRAERDRYMAVVEMVAATDGPDDWLDAVNAALAAVEQRKA